MEHTVPHDHQPPPDVKSWQLWFSLAAGTVVWLIHLMIVYPLTSLTCEWGWFPSTVNGLTGLQVVQIIITIIAAIIIAVAGVFAFQNQRRLRTQEINRHYFMAQLGLALNILFFALVVVSLVPILSLPVCS